ncbi:MAG: hypothetical protein KBD63_02315 [Bacteriovoracaceae bacterium]|nr:hypothetical protein [Bacteriovoracaceae bacterium]
MEITKPSNKVFVLFSFSLLSILVGTTLASYFVAGLQNGHRYEEHYQTLDQLKNFKKENILGVMEKELEQGNLKNAKKEFLSVVGLIKTTKSQVGSEFPWGKFENLSQEIENLLQGLEGQNSSSAMVKTLREKNSNFLELAKRNKYRNLERISERVSAHIATLNPQAPDFSKYHHIIGQDLILMKKVTENSVLNNKVKKEILAQIQNVEVYHARLDQLAKSGSTLTAKMADYKTFVAKAFNATERSLASQSGTLYSAYQNFLWLLVAVFVVSLMFTFLAWSLFYKEKKNPVVLSSLLREKMLLEIFPFPFFLLNQGGDVVWTNQNDLQIYKAKNNTKSSNENILDFFKTENEILLSDYFKNYMSSLDSYSVYGEKGVEFELQKKPYAFAGKDYIVVILQEKKIDHAMTTVVANQLNQGSLQEVLQSWQNNLKSFKNLAIRSCSLSEVCLDEKEQGRLNLQQEVKDLEQEMVITLKHSFEEYKKYEKSLKKDRKVSSLSL